MLLIFPRALGDIFNSVAAVQHTKIFSLPSSLCDEEEHKIITFLTEAKNSEYLIFFLEK